MSDPDSNGATDDQIYQFLHQALGRDLHESESRILPAASGRDHALLDVGPPAGALGSFNDNVIRFNPMASPNTKGETFPWKLQAPLRNDLLMILLRSLCHHSVWLLIAGRLKPQNLQRSRLVQDLQEATMPRSSR